MTINLLFSLAGVLVGLVVGLTGVGAGALGKTQMLIHYPAMPPTPLVRSHI
jgi:hypothetical protein